MPYKLTNKSNLTHQFPGGVTVAPGENLLEDIPASVLATIRETYVATGQMELEGSGPVEAAADAEPSDTDGERAALAEARAKLEADQEALVQAATEELQKLEKAHADLDAEGAKLRADREAFEAERQAFEEAKAKAAAEAPKADATAALEVAAAEKPADAAEPLPADEADDSPNAGS